MSSAHIVLTAFLTARSVSLRVSPSSCARTRGRVVSRCCSRASSKKARTSSSKSEVWRCPAESSLSSWYTQSTMGPVMLTRGHSLNERTCRNASIMRASKGFSRPCIAGRSMATRPCRSSTPLCCSSSTRRRVAERPPTPGILHRLWKQWSVGAALLMSSPDDLPNEVSLRANAAISRGVLEKGTESASPTTLTVGGRSSRPTYSAVGSMPQGME
mmetsp:Transcript_9263/g.25967  ORF Transcript_9263/g.25967 Transcript_9263/m.25967 type:complete len:215 (-) Transcript_9263:97-741(-)